MKRDTSARRSSSPPAPAPSGWGCPTSSGVSGCATCDGFFFRGKDVAVIGGGDTAMEEALFLTKYATRVHLLHRRDTFRASKIMQRRARNHEKITIHTNVTVEDVLGENSVEGLVLRHLDTGETETL